MRPQQVSDAEILTIARQIFIKTGYAAPVSIIAEELGVSQPALFKRFGTKKNLFIAAMKPPQRVPWIDLAVKGPDHRPFKEQLEQIIHEIFLFFETIGPALQVIKISDIPPEEFLDVGEEPMPVKALRVLTSWIDQCAKKDLIEKVDATIVAINILGACHLDSFIGTVFVENKVHRHTIASKQSEFVSFYAKALEKE